MNDSHVTAVSVNKVLSSQAYILFYTKLKPGVQSEAGLPEVFPSGVLPRKPEIKTALQPTAAVTVEHETRKGSISPRHKLGEYGRLKKRAPWVLFFPLRYLFNNFSVLEAITPSLCRFKGPLQKFEKWRSLYNGLRNIREGPTYSNETRNQRENTAKLLNEDEKINGEKFNDPEIKSEPDRRVVNKDSFPVNWKDGGFSSSKTVAQESSFATVLLEQSRRSRIIGSEGIWEGTNVDVASRISKLATIQKRTEQGIRKRNAPSEWDQLLDTGKQKKFKASNPVSDENKNFFQALVNRKFKQSSF
jgi:hypothetical protein